MTDHAETGLPPHPATLGRQHTLPDNPEPVYVTGSLKRIEEFYGPSSLRASDRKGDVLADAYGADPRSGPAGEDTPEARLVNVSRWSLAARIRQGAPISELLPALTSLAEVEARLIGS